MPTTLARLEAKIEFDESGCWLWTGYKHADGYGLVKVDGKNRLAHRVVYEMLVGPVPEGLELDHLCRVRACVNPDHVEPVTHAENMRRSDSLRFGWHREVTHCPQGHAYDEANTYQRPDRPGRICRACGRERARAARAAHVPVGVS